MFQHTSARLRSGSASTAARSIWLTDSGAPGPARSDPRAVEVDPARVAAVEVEEARSRDGDVAGQRRQHPDRAHDVAAARLTLESLAHPQQRRASPIGARDVLDETRRHARLLLAPGRRARLEQRLELVVAEHVLAHEGVVDEPLAADHVGQRERERGIAARPKLEVRVRLIAGGRANRVDHDHLAARLAQPVVVRMRRTRRGIGAPHDDAGRLGRGLRVDPSWLDP